MQNEVCEIPSPGTVPLSGVNTEPTKFNVQSVKNKARRRRQHQLDIEEYKDRAACESTMYGIRPRRSQVSTYGSRTTTIISNKPDERGLLEHTTVKFSSGAYSPARLRVHDDEPLLSVYK
jgi:hypothetical protein